MSRFYKYLKDILAEFYNEKINLINYQGVEIDNDYIQHPNFLT